MTGGARFMRGLAIGLPASAIVWAAALIPVFRLI